ncbi:TetR/AcrR family transcriptional regulator [Amycolatopsis sp. K13G38]|uniref:TetR/AcrR family transcriptional regulator n=1 Tax=Amycolatopsis acididurans TaxID=2724524 RepID=A0ABX1JDN1_9PSEU|nr:TetR/AcrR family transcriptional regulator [Amycolatopsis acididurans]NKQ57758.1 TetR/AcrR family transcriptional regulator [Amycolatopsis acididurans]
MDEPAVRPARGTRPRNRRALIIAAAAEKFATRGYDRVSVGEIAATVSIGPSALYRHFSGKPQLLVETITAGLDPIRTVVNEVDLAEDTGRRRIASLSLGEQRLAVLWRREARHLSLEDRKTVVLELRGIGRALTQRVREARPDLGETAADLIRRCLVSVLTSPSHHRLDLDRPQYEAVLAELAGIVLDAQVQPDLPAAPTENPGRATLIPASRREALLAAAVHLFATRGYKQVGNEDIAAAVGIAGPSIYNNFSSKSEMLVTAFRRGTAVLFTDLSHAYRTATTPADALRQLIRSYLTAILHNPDLAGLLITEIEHLPDDERHETRRAQSDYISEWVHLLRGTHPDLSPAVARVRVHAVLNIINDAGRTVHVRRNPAMTEALPAICAEVLGVGQEVVA